MTHRSLQALPQASTAHIYAGETSGNQLSVLQAAGQQQQQVSSSNTA
jgi:hypothetical protein